MHLRYGRRAGAGTRDQPCHHESRLAHMAYSGCLGLMSRITLGNPLIDVNFKLTQIHDVDSLFISLNACTGYHVI
jgi:hypothetical protein